MVQGTKIRGSAISAGGVFGRNYSKIYIVWLMNCILLPFSLFSNGLYKFKEPHGTPSTPYVDATV